MKWRFLSLGYRLIDIYMCVHIYVNSGCRHLKGNIQHSLQQIAKYAFQKLSTLKSQKILLVKRIVNIRPPI